eukprot:CAMPEP_0204316266 /NCGR_PEP_ID=MMETSP0469-20131031/5296_1 /ASSEMBLY_ACC=CAM_ASM_000384 /TAXON_ID=2969 /ORGANISM="Oxyrrhis marina" /LENGTH=200 /DNA_ID=CAMNT_0051297015 /DNA_START=244 /DNA_END=843 /DNA_ORIENTATION=-
MASLCNAGLHPNQERQLIARIPLQRGNRRHHPLPKIMRYYLHSISTNHSEAQVGGTLRLAVVLNVQLHPATAPLEALTPTPVPPHVRSQHQAKPVTEELKEGADTHGLKELRCLESMIQETTSMPSSPGTSRYTLRSPCWDSKERKSRDSPLTTPATSAAIEQSSDALETMLGESLAQVGMVDIDMARVLQRAPRPAQIT